MGIVSDGGVHRHVTVVAHEARRDRQIQHGDLRGRIRGRMEGELGMVQQVGLGERTHPGPHQDPRLEALVAQTAVRQVDRNRGVQLRIPAAAGHAQFDAVALGNRLRKQRRGLARELLEVGEPVSVRVGLELVRPEHRLLRVDEPVAVRVARVVERRGLQFPPTDDHRPGQHPHNRDDRSRKCKTTQKQERRRHAEAHGEPPQRGCPGPDGGCRGIVRPTFENGQGNGFFPLEVHSATRRRARAPPREHPPAAASLPQTRRSTPVPSRLACPPPTCTRSSAG